MKTQTFIPLAATVIVLSLIASCSPQQPQAANPSSSAAAEAPAEAIANPSPSEAEITAQRPVVGESANPDCENAQTQAEMTSCAGERVKKADDKLNQVYQQLRADIKGSPQEQRLIDAQLAWIQFRDKDCEYNQRQFDGGSIMPMIYSQCMADLTEQRTQQLENYLESAER